MYVQHTFWINVSAHIQEEEARQVAFINQLREPAHRLASAFAWNRALCCGKRPPDWCGDGLVNRQQQLGACRKGVSLDAVWSLLRAQQRFDRCLPCRYLCGAHAGSTGCAAQAACSHDSACEHSVEEVEWSALLSNAKERLSTSFAVVGIIEDLPSTLAVLAARLPTFFGPPLNMSQYIRTRLNANGNHDANQSTGSLEWTRLEQQLYSHAKVRLATQLASCRNETPSELGSHMAFVNERPPCAAWKEAVEPWVPNTSLRWSDTELAGVRSSRGDWLRRNTVTRRRTRRSAPTSVC